MIYHSKPIYLNGASLSDWMREQTKQTLSNRYKACHMAEDIGVSNATFSRFMKGNTVSSEFVDKWFKFFTKEGY